MARYLSDTHALVWHLTSDPSLSPSAAAAFSGADKGEDEIVIPSIVLVEIVYLAEKVRIPPSLVARLMDLLAKPGPYVVAPLDLAVVRELAAIDRGQVPDMPDRIICATARRLGIPLLTRDRRISAATGIKAIW